MPNQIYDTHTEQTKKCISRLPAYEKWVDNVVGVCVYVCACIKTNISFIIIFSNKTNFLYILFLCSFSFLMWCDEDRYGEKLESKYLRYIISTNDDDEKKRHKNNTRDDQRAAEMTTIKKCIKI